MTKRNDRQSTSILLNPPACRCNADHCKRFSGFSLAEITMLLLILSVVTIPMVMMLGLQKSTLQRDQEDIQNKATVAQLFDDVNPQVADPIGAFQVDDFPTNLPIYHYSVYCDPESKISLSSTCTTTSPPGTTQKQAPFFQRLITYAPEYKALSVTINLFHTNAINNNPAYYSETRQYDLTSYHAYTSANDISYINNTPDNVANLFEGSDMEVDASGNIWYPEITVNSPATTVPNYAYYVYYSNGVGTAATNNTTESTLSPVLTPGVTSTNKIPFDKYMQLNASSPSSAQTANYNFKVVPNSQYDVNVYLSIPPNKIAGSNCLSNTTGNSCALVNISAILQPICGTLSMPSSCLAPSYLKQYDNFDVAAATGLSSQSNYTQASIFHTTFKTLPPANSSVIGETLTIQVAPTYYSNGGTTGTTSVYVSGIEVLRRPDS